IDRLFRCSGLHREKWDRSDYRERTIAKALEGRSEFYSGHRNDAYPESVPSGDGSDRLTASGAAGENLHERASSNGESSDRTGTGRSRTDTRPTIVVRGQLV